MSGPFYAMKFPLGVGNTTRHDDIYYEQRKIITNIADRENCIIVGCERQERSERPGCMCEMR